MARCHACGKDWPPDVETCPVHRAPLRTLVDPASAAVPAPARLELGPGVLIGEWRLEARIGAGGMGEVFAAVHTVIGKRAAIKVVKHDLSQNTAAADRFVHEARAVNQIAHPNIVDVFSFGELPDGRRYLVMELLQGESLKTRLERGRLSLDEAAAILEPVCRALEAAHGKGIIHRDLKPDNVFLAEPGATGEPRRVKLLDFGIAKLEGDEHARLERTRTGSLLGTPLYISPEQARGHEVDHRTDLYALGVMTFEMVVGRPPFQADNAMDVIASHLWKAPPPARDFAPATPRALERLILGLMAKEAAARPSLAEARAVLAGIRGGVLAVRATARRRFVAPLAAGLALAVLVAGGVVALRARGGPDASPDAAPRVAPAAVEAPPVEPAPAQPAVAAPAPDAGAVPTPEARPGRKRPERPAPVAPPPAAAEPVPPPAAIPPAEPPPVDDDAPIDPFRR